MNRLLLGTFAALITATSASAEDWDFILTNNSGKTIKTVEISAAGANNWAPNKIDPELRKETAIKPNAKTTIHFDKGPGCQYDLKATFEDDSSAVWSGVNVCDNSYVTILYNNGTATFRAS